MRDHALGVDDEQHRDGHTVARPARRKIFVEQTEGADDRRFRVGEQGEADVAALREPRQRPNIVIADRGEGVAKRREFLDFVVPGDRLGLAVNSPIQRAGEQQDQSALARERRKIARHAMLIPGRERMGNRHADFRPVVEPVLRAGRRNQ